jgi:excisionase family DNA binding protein
MSRGKAMRDEKLLLTALEVAILTGFALGTIRHWVSERRIPFVRISNRCVRFRKEDIEKWISEMSVAVNERNQS